MERFVSGRERDREEKGMGVREREKEEVSYWNSEKERSVNAKLQVLTQRSV